MIMLERQLIGIALFFIFLGILFWSSVALQDTFFEAATFTRQYVEDNQLASGILFVALAALAVIISPLTSTPLVPIAVVVWGNGITILLLLIGWLTGGGVIYAIARFLGYPLLRRFHFTKTIDMITYYETRLPKKTIFGLALLFRFAVPSEIAGYVLGLIRYDFFKYIAVTLIYELIVATLVVYISDAFVQRQITLFIALIVIFFVIMGTALYFLRKYMKQ